MKNKIIKNFVLFFFSSLLCTSCVTVKEYQKVYINDPDMSLAMKKTKKFETASHVYREASAGANGGKSGGGCGCN